MPNRNWVLPDGSNVMKLRCPECNYDLTRRASEVCPECGRASTDKQLIAYARSAAHPHLRADIVFHCCAIAVCGLFGAVFLLVGIGFVAPFPYILGLVFILGGIGLGISVARVVKRERVIRGDD